MNLNKVIIGGRMTRDCELRYLNNGTAVGDFGVAINHVWKDNNGEKREDVTFVDCTAWGKTAETIGEYLGKGSNILIEGRLKLDQWEDKKDGGKRSKISVVIERFHFVDSAKREEGAGDDDDAPRSNARSERPKRGKSRPARQASTRSNEPSGDPESETGGVDEPY